MEAEEAEEADSGDSNPVAEEPKEAKVDEDALLAEEEDNSSMVVSIYSETQTLMVWFFRTQNLCVLTWIPFFTRQVEPPSMISDSILEESVADQTSTSVKE